MTDVLRIHLAVQVRKGHCVLVMQKFKGETKGFAVDTSMQGVVNCY
jgi:hypothetical protein